MKKFWRETWLRITIVVLLVSLFMEGGNRCSSRSIYSANEGLEDSALCRDRFHPRNILTTKDQPVPPVAWILIHLSEYSLLSFLSFLINETRPIRIQIDNFLRNSEEWSGGKFSHLVTFLCNLACNFTNRIFQRKYIPKDRKLGNFANSLFPNSPVL